jgi:diacylglycerol kinase
MRKPEAEPEPSSDRSWSEKFRCAFRGVNLGVRGQSSFFVHFFMTMAVIAAGWVLKVDKPEWYILTLCIIGVLTTEMFNSALEAMGRAITHEYNPHLGAALDIGSAAVLVASIGAALVGSLIFYSRIIHLLFQ